MTTHNIIVCDTEQEAEGTIAELKQKGFTQENISIIAKNPDKLDADSDPKITTRKGIVAGATAGGVVGLASLLIGMSSFALPGIGVILAAGPIMTTLGGAAAGAAATESGGLTGAFKNAGLSKEDVDRYFKAVENGKILVIVEK